MKSLIGNSLVVLAAGGVILVGTGAALAHTPLELADRQLDYVTAGGATVIGSADAQANGALSLTGTVTNAYVVQPPSPIDGQPGLASSGGVVTGTAVALGTNLGLQGQPPASTGTNVTTAGNATGNLVINFTHNSTVQAAGGLTVQTGVTVVYGIWLGL